MVALLRGATERKSDRLSAEAMNYGCKMWNRCVNSSLDRDVSPYQLWCGRRPTFGNVPPFGTLGYMRQPLLNHKLAPCGAKSIMLGPAIDFPRGASRVRDHTTGQVVVRQAINLDPPVVVSKNGPIPGSPEGTHKPHTGSFRPQANN